LKKKKKKKKNTVVITWMTGATCCLQLKTENKSKNLNTISIEKADIVKEHD